MTDSWSARMVQDRYGSREHRTRLAGGPQLNAQQIAWLLELIADCDKSARPTAWERNFVQDIASRLQQRGADLVLSDKQSDVLKKIEEKIHAAG